jgi:hypothetical protein
MEARGEEPEREGVAKPQKEDRGAEHNNVSDSAVPRT